MQRNTTTLRFLLAILTLVAAMLASFSATLRLPSLYCTLPAGLVLAMVVLLAVVALANCVRAYPARSTFSFGFFTAGLICFTLASSDAFTAANTAPEHVARAIWRFHPNGADSTGDQNSRFYALQHLVNLWGMLTVAVISALLSRDGCLPDTTKPKDSG